MYRPPLAALIAGLLAAPAMAQTTQDALLDTIVVTATRIATPDVAAPYASEIHTRKMIEQSGTSTLYDYLAQDTSVQVMPAFGSRAMPLLDMRGYGLESGYQNIAITVDGQRLNNIDQVSQLIGTLPLADIERIEITKGSGSVMYGDGATAGSIQIQTRMHRGVNIDVGAGNFGARSMNGSAGLDSGRVSVSVNGAYDAQGGTGADDASGHRDESGNRAWHGTLEVNPVQPVKLGLDAGSTRLDDRYVYPLTLGEFHADPAQFPAAYAGKPYNHQLLAADSWRVRAELMLGTNWKFSASHGREDRQSDFIAWYGPWPSSYAYQTNDLALHYGLGRFDATLGAQVFNGTRIGSSDRTSKDNRGWYAQGQYRSHAWNLSAGARTESIEYRYAPDAGSSLRGDHRLTAFDLGLNRRLSDSLNLFANLNQAFQAPDIDRFFAYDFATGAYTFNALIAPEQSRTLNLGLNRVSAANRLKVALFRAELRNEIYFNPATFANTNLARSHKYGLELQDTWRLAQAWSSSLNYTFTHAVIDRQTDVGGAYDGKDLPGVPRHGVVLGLAYAPRKDQSLNITHNWRDAAWAIGDFANGNAQRQAAYQSTNLAYRQRAGRIEWTATVQNLFAHRNGLWTGDDAIYPVNFTRSYRVGVSARF